MLLSDKLLLLEEPYYFIGEWLLAIPFFGLIYFFSSNLLISLVIVLFLMIIAHYVLYFKKAKYFNDTIANFRIAIAIIQELPIGLCICNSDGDIVWNNHILNRYLIDSEVSNNSNILTLFGQQNTEQFLYKNNGKVLTVEINQEQYLEYSIVNLPDCDYYLVYIKDISDRVFLENSRKIFFGNISHELRIPLTVLKGYIEILETERKQQRYDKSDLKPYKNMQAQVDRLLNMVSQLLTLTKIENNPFLEDQHLVDMPDIIYSIYDEAQVRNSNKQKISLYLNDELFVKGHEQSLREVVSNLVYNAIEHNPKNSEIEIHWKKVIKDEQDYALFLIKDNGVGISKEHLNRLTERFYVVDSARNRGNNKNIGSGLGLAIVKNALKRHDSQLIVESEKNQGSCFKFYLPVYSESSKSNAN